MNHRLGEPMDEKTYSTFAAIVGPKHLTAIEKKLPRKLLRIPKKYKGASVYDEVALIVGPKVVRELVQRMGRKKLRIRKSTSVAPQPVKVGSF